MSLLHEDERVGIRREGRFLVATAGVDGNAARAGEPARWHETPAGSRKVEDAERASESERNGGRNAVVS